MRSLIWRLKRICESSVSCPLISRLKSPKRRAKRARTSGLSMPTPVSPLHTVVVPASPDSSVSSGWSNSAVVVPVTMYVSVSSPK